MTETLIYKGVTQITIDAKGRLAIPSKYRQSLIEYCGGKLVITVDRDECLLIYPEPAWQKIQTAIINLPGLNKQARLIQRLTLGHAMDCEMNSQGRVLLPPPLREFAHINKQALLMGQGHKFELWDYERWTRQRDKWLDEESDTKEVHAVLEDIPL